MLLAPLVEVGEFATTRSLTYPRLGLFAGALLVIGITETLADDVTPFATEITPRALVAETTPRVF